MYWFLFVLFRFVLRRDMGTIGVADVLLLVIIADAAQNAMAGDYKTITDGMVLVGTIAFWNYGLDVLSYVSPRVRRFAQPPALLLIKDGRMLLHNCRRQFVSAGRADGQAARKGHREAGAGEARVPGDGRRNQRDQARAGGSRRRGRCEARQAGGLEPIAVSNCA
jgi:hypothetical protein